MIKQDSIKIQGKYCICLKHEHMFGIWFQMNDNPLEKMSTMTTMDSNTWITKVRQNLASFSQDIHYQLS